MRVAVAKVEDLLHRRTDLSTFLVHFTRQRDIVSARQRLLMILRDGRLRRGQALGMAMKQANDRRLTRPGFYQSQQVICFTETPLEHAWMMCESIETRLINFGPYGIAVTKTWGRSEGINPVWYLDISRRGVDWLTGPVNRIVADALQAGNYAHDIFRLTPLIEQMGPTGDKRKEFWWEREWRLAGRDLPFTPGDIVAILAPANQHASLQVDLAALPHYANVRMIDPRWGLERIVAKLAGVADSMAGPWPRP